MNAKIEKREFKNIKNNFRAGAETAGQLSYKNTTSAPTRPTH
jgi:hypothetical protein